VRCRFLLAVAAAVLLGVMPPVAGSGPGRPDGAPAPVRSVIETVSLASAAAVEPGVRETTGRRFAMVALRWSGAAPAGVRVQALHTGGSWGPWRDIEQQDGPDGRPAAGSEPLWVGHATALRVHAVQPDGLSVVLIDPGIRAADAALGENAAGGAAAGAAAVVQPAVISRAGWGADETIRTDCFARQGIGVDYAATVKAATIHHTAGTNDYTAAESAQIVRGIYAYHAITNDWCDIGYNVLVDKYGQIFEGRFGGLRRPVWGAHAGGFNQFTFGVSMLGTFIGVTPSAAQLEAVSAMVAWKFAGSYRDPNSQVTLVSGGGGTSKYPAGVPVTLPRIIGHRDTGNTECPGDVGYLQLPAIRQRVTQIMGNWQSSPVYAKWQNTGGDEGSLGGAYEVETTAAGGGRWTAFNYANSTVYWASATGAHIVKGAILATWSGFSRESGFLGYPTTDELGTTDGVGRYNNFASGGSIYWSPSSGAHEVHGAIKSKWVALGAEHSLLGYPATDELLTLDGAGRYNHFSGGGSVYWHPTVGAHEVHGAIKLHWASLGYEHSYLGYPISDEYAIPGGRRSDFQNGYITWNAATGAVTDKHW
jgi:uncharacterized protein with LGFP repeats